MTALQVSAHASEAAALAIVRQIAEFIAKFQQRQHPFLLLVVGDHRFHRLVALDHGANPAAETTLAARRQTLIEHQRTFVVRRRPAIHGQKIVIGIAPRILVLHQKHPDIIVRPCFQRRKYQLIGQCRIGTQKLANPLLFKVRHRAMTTRALLFARSQNQDDLAVLSKLLLDKVVHGTDLQPIRAPAILHARERVTPAEKIHPKCMIVVGHEPRRNERQLTRCSSITHRCKRPLHPLGDDRRLHQCIGIHDMHGLLPLLQGKSLDRQPDELHDGGAVLAARIADHPGDVIGHIEVLDRRHHGGDLVLRYISHRRRIPLLYSSEPISFEYMISPCKSQIAPSISEEETTGGSSFPALPCGAKPRFLR